MSKVRCTVVVPMLNEARSLAALSQRLTQVCEANDLDWEVIFVDDGSTDDSYEEVKKIHAADGRFKCLRFARNFGSHIAISAGLEQAYGDIAIVMTADLEEPPETIGEFLRMWREGYHLVWGVRARRVERGLNRLGSYVYHRVFRWLANMKEGDDEIGGGFFLADRRVLDTVRRFPERNRSIVGLLLWAGFKQGKLVYEQEARQFGASKWSLAKKLRLVLDTFVGFSNKPLRVMLVFGGVVALLGLAAGAFAIVEVLARGALSSAGVAAAIFGVIASATGAQLAATGLLGEYLWRAVDDSRGRPLYVVMDRLGVGEGAARPS